jgi:predicted nucleic acid-binding protein
VNFLLDTNVVSEWIKAHPNVGVVTWLNECDEDRIFLSVVTIAELRHGIDRMPSGARRERIDKWLTEELLLRFEGRVLGIDTYVANIWGIFIACIKTSGRSIGPMDACIAAIAKHHGFTLVTRNVADFKGFKIKILNPWT